MKVLLMKSYRKNGGDDMTGTILEFGPLEGGEELAFDKAVHGFTNWCAEIGSNCRQPGEMPDLMIKTFCNNNGELCKSVMFEHEQWASVFMRIWQSNQQAR